MVASQIYVRKLACLCGHVFVEASHLPLGMHLEKVMSVQQALETEEQTAKRRKSNKECVVETCTCMVNTATICMYMHGHICYSMYVHAWYISRITRECPTDPLLTTHAHYIREGFVEAR